MSSMNASRPDATHGFQARNSDFAQRCRDSFGRQGAMALLGARMTRLEPGRCRVELPYREDLSQQHGYFHGGILTTVADSAAGYAASSLVDGNTSVLTVEFKVNVLAPAMGELLIASGEVLRPGRTLCGSMVQTIMNMQGRDERALDDRP
jgi:uncharacterized protein (TIGR00369 family)